MSTKEKKTETVKRDSILRVSAEAAEFVHKYGEKHSISSAEAADKLVLTARNRLTALSKYNKKSKGDAKPRAKKPAAVKAKAKAPKKGAAKKSGAPRKKRAAAEVQASHANGSALPN